jgi:hypothetical protein
MHILDITHSLYTVYLANLRTTPADDRLWSKHVVNNKKQEVLGGTNCLLSFDTTRTA